ncbi:heterokaryon incompatibility protein 6, OR allele-like [Teratosphaeria destructans]|uniref:Heterokaryon incompatibility protein 6, OR allele-like n=1 Tax=Teratosphaeria destructans TaxID=418781 RepID=A0A9W7STN5_9PEZI|nr:heterokaryon incompatibility protein 6, OR allele-like [Teratosphaeria destructans]
MNLTRWKSPSQRQKSEELLDFHHGLLRSSKTSIRLAQILPGSGTKRVAINLIDSFVSGPGQQPYDALSYTWGDDLRTKYVKCNNKRLAVTTTLLEALQRFRDSDKVVTLWIDQICICQGRISERNEQVQLMGDIFRAASKVVVWLGNDYDDSAAGMQLAKQLLHIAQSRNVSRLGADDLETHGLPKRGHRRWKAFAAILRRPWFWRTWVVQEVVLNPHVELVLGPNSLSWDELESIIALLEGPLPTDWQLDQAISAAVLPFSRINKIRSRHRRTITTLLSPFTPDAHLDGGVVAEPESMKTPTNADDPELLDLLLMSRGLGASDPRDKIYALLGLSKHDIHPDYSLSPESVFTDFALQTIGAATLALSKREALSLDLSSDVREVAKH